MRGARSVRSRSYAYQRRLIQRAMDAIDHPEQEEIADVEDRLVGMGQAIQELEELEDEHAWLRRRRSLALTSQILLVAATLVVFGALVALLVLRPNVLGALGLAALLGTLVRLLMKTWRWAQGGGDRAVDELDEDEQLAFDFDPRLSRDPRAESGGELRARRRSSQRATARR